MQLSKIKTIVYWITTALLALDLLAGGTLSLLHPSQVLATMAHLGYPAYFASILGFWKLLGGIALLVPDFPLLKEWAYAGIFFDLTGAAASCAMSGGYGAYGFHVIAPLLIAGFMLASWALRPPNRTLGILFPAKNSAVM